MKLDEAGCSGAWNSGEEEPCELAVVMPVYNEEACIFKVVASWEEELARQRIDFRMIVLNDGSRDGTAAILHRFRDRPRIEIIDKENSGHGPTILQGYRRAARLAEWVFQTDSDDEMKPSHFAELWRGRNDFDALLAVRHRRRQPVSRRLTSLGSRLTVALLFGRRVTDVNVPYRLIRASCLGRIIRQIPEDALTPNILISGALARSSLRICNRLIPCEGRTTGSPAVMRWKLVEVALLSFWQALCFRVDLTRGGSYPG
jgi:dolichol-phosphate mannosyltransferase